MSVSCSSTLPESSIQTRRSPITILRLSQYGTILSSSADDTTVGLPVMRFIHNNDLPRICAALNEACHAHECPIQCRARFLSDTPDVYIWHTVIATANAKNQLSVIVQQQEMDASAAEQTSLHASSLLLPAWFVSSVHQRICDAVQHGLITLAERLSYGLVMMVRMLQKHGISADATSIRPELDRLFKILAWAGLSKDQDGFARVLLSRVLDNSLQWWMDQMARYPTDDMICDAVV